MNEGFYQSVRKGRFTGGVKGAIEAVFLAELERRSGRAVSDLFDVIAGSSTGGILAAGLSARSQTGASKITAANCVDLYLKQSKKIFSQSIWHSLYSCFGVFGPRYESIGIESVLADKFQELTLTDVRTNLMISGQDVETGRHVFFKSWEAIKGEAENFYLKDIVRATTAAPTIFSPATIKSLQGNEYTIIDGALQFNSPALAALLEARKLYPDGREYIVLSLGTDRDNRAYSKAEISSWNSLTWARKIGPMLLKNSIDSVDYYLNSMGNLMREPIDYYRFNVNLGPDLDYIDYTAASHMQALVAKGEQMVQENDQLIDRLVLRLTNPDDHFIDV